MIGELSKEQEIISIICPLSCAITLSGDPENPQVSGHECNRGRDYALQEAADPRRVLAGAVRISGGSLPRLPVKTSAAIPRKMILEAARLLDRISITVPQRCGELIAANFANSGADLIATRELPPAEE